MPDTVQFVNSIASSPTVRLDLNDDTTWGLAVDGTDLSPPNLAYAVAHTLLADGAVYPASAYTDRLLKLRLELKAATVDAAATQIQKLARELDRPTNILKWQPGTTNPVFFRTVRSPVGRITEVPGTGTLKFFDVTVLAEPFAYGIEETLSDIAIGGDPATGVHADVTNIKGDIETPLVLVTGRNFGALTALRQAVFATKRRPGSITVTGVVQAESLTSLGADTTAVTVAGYSGGTPNATRTTFATDATLVARISGYMNLAGGLDRRGEYRVWARVKKSVAGDPVTMRLRYGFFPGGPTLAAVTLPATTNVVYVDLGLMPIPFGHDPVTHGFSGVEAGVADQYILVDAARGSGTTNLEIDVLVFVPADDQLSIETFVPYGGAAGPALVWDGPNEVLYQSGNGVAGGTVGDLTAMTSSAGAGAIMVSPGVTNRIWSLRQVAPGAATDLLSETYKATYWPRYLYVRPAST